MHVNVVLIMMLPLWLVGMFPLTIVLFMCTLTQIIHVIVFKLGFHACEGGGSISVSGHWTSGHFKMDILKTFTMGKIR